MKKFYLGKRPTPEHRASAIRKIAQGQPGRSPRFYVDHYSCTDWFIWVPDQSYNTAYAIDPGAGQWQYLTTTCDYVDSFWVDDGTGTGGGGGGGGTSDLSNRDNLLQGCRTAAGTAKTAEQTHIVGNPGYEWAGFVLRGPDGRFYYSQGELLSLNDNLAADEKYATDNHLDAYVMLLWSDTSSGSSNERTAFYGWKPGMDPGVSGETDNGKESC